MINGVAGKILFVDLSDKNYWIEDVGDDIYRTYLSGLGLGVKVLYDRIPAGADPLGPENILGFLAGALTGMAVMFGGRFQVVGKSPLTGGWGDANCGGNLAPAIKKSGFDGIFFTGCSTEPVYVHIQDNQVEILPAADLWGKDTIETEDLLQERHGGRVRVACIGPAGENLVRFAGISNQHGRMAARSGLGSVMGSKKLKAIVIEGKQKSRAADPGKIKHYNKTISQLMPKGKNKFPGWIFKPVGWLMSKISSGNRVDGLSSLAPFSRWGTSSGNEVAIITGDAPIRNWRGTPSLYPSSAVSVTKIEPTQRKKYHCVSCPLGCGSIAEMKDGSSVTHRPEYETIISFGSNLLNQDLESIYELSDYCNRMGMDTISTGSLVGFALDCHENNLLKENLFKGFNIKWGDPESIFQLVDDIAHRQGIGDLLADGVRVAAERIGPESEQFAFHAGGQELPMHDPRIDPAYGVIYLSDPTPGRHTITSRVEYEMFRLWTQVPDAPEPPRRYKKSDKYLNDEVNARMNVMGSLYKAVLDCAGLCLFGAHVGADRLGVFEMLNGVFGFDLQPGDYMEIGRRVQDLRQWFNIKHGLVPSDVCMNPLISGKIAADKGPAKGLKFDLFGMRSLYWKTMGWDELTGQPLRKPDEVLLVD